MKQIYAKSIIDKKLKNNIFIDLDFEDDKAYINIFFNSIDSYNKFISEPTIYKNYFSAAARNLYKDLVDEICNNTSKANFKFIRIIKKSNTHIRLYSLNDLDNNL